MNEILDASASAPLGRAAPPRGARARAPEEIDTPPDHRGARAGPWPARPWRFIVIEGEARRRIGETIAAAFRADQPGGRGRDGRLRAQPPRPRAARRRRRVAGAAAREDPGMGADPVGRRGVHEPRHRRERDGLRRLLDHRMVRLRPARARRARPRAGRAHRRLRPYRAGRRRRRPSGRVRLSPTS